MEAEDLARAIGSIQLEVFDDLSEPGTRTLIDDFSERMATPLKEEVRATGSSMASADVVLTLRRQMARAYLASNLIAAMELERIGTLDEDDVGFWYHLDTRLAMASVENEEKYPGLAVAMLNSLPAMDEALVVCSLMTLQEAGIAPSAIPESLAHLLTIATKVGFSMGVAEATARAVAFLARGDVSLVPVPIGFHVVQAASTPDSKVNWELLTEKLVDHPEPGVSSAARALALASSAAPATVDPDELLQNGLTYLTAGQLEPATECLRHAARSGQAEATYILAMFSEVGIGGDEVPTKHKLLITEAAAAGHKGALGECLLEGIGRDADRERGLALLTECAESGSSFAQGSLGGYYATGEYVTKNRDLAKQWLERSAGNGNPFAVMMLEHFEL